MRKKMSLYKRVNLPMLRPEIKDIFIKQRHEVFEEGVENSLSKDLKDAINKCGRSGAVVIAMFVDLVHQDQIRYEIVSEVARWLGRIEGKIAYEERVEILMELLSHPAPSVREGAVLGLSYLNAKKVIPHIKNAASIERNTSLKQFMDGVVKDLEEKHGLNRTENEVT